MRRPKFPAVVLVVGFGFSLAANILWCWPGGPVRILGGVLASIALPAAIHMWPQVHAGTWLTRSIRNLVMTGIASLAAVTTFAHAARLLIAHGEDPWLAAAYPVMTELMVVLAVLSHRPAPRPSVPRTQTTAEMGATPRPVSAVHQPADATRGVRQNVKAKDPKAAERAKRARDRKARHEAGDHSACIAGNCPHAPTNGAPIREQVMV